MHKPEFKLQACFAFVAALTAGVLASIPSEALAQSASRPPQSEVPPRIEYDDGPAGSLAIGGDGSSTGYALFAGGTYALNGRLYDEGVLLRATAGVGEYRAGVTPFATDRNVTFYSGSLLVGYQTKVGDANVAAFVGPELVHNGRGADPRVRGTEWAARAIAEAYFPGESVDFSLWSSYSTFENQYFVTGRSLIHDMPNTGGIGPEIALFGGDGYQRMRAGIHAALPLRSMQIGVSSGYDWDTKGDARESLYGNLIFSFAM